MKVKKIGKASLDLEKEMWRVGVGSERYKNNRRLVDTKPEVKAARHVYSRASSRHTPAKRKTEKRKAYMDEVKDLRKTYETALREAFDGVKKESFNFPILLCLDRDYDHKGDWRYCMFEGIIYQFDRPGYSDDEMTEAIRKLENKDNKGETSEPG